MAGPKVAALTLLRDCLKGAICVLIARPLIASVGYGFPVSIMAPGAAGDWMLGVICLAAVWGHIFSPYLNFHGGKGIAVGLGVILAWYWPIGLSLLGMFIVAVAITAPNMKDYVHLAKIKSNARKLRALSGKGDETDA